MNELKTFSVSATVGSLFIPRGLRVAPAACSALFTFDSTVDKLNYYTAIHGKKRDCLPALRLQSTDKLLLQVLSMATALSAMLSVIALLQSVTHCHSVTADMVASQHF